MKENYSLLYVDDEPINLLVFEKSFENHFRITTASSGREGLEILQGQPEIEVLVSDFQMPYMNGIEFIDAAKKKWPSLKCFILTAYDINPEIRQALHTGLIEKYFQKPFDVSLINQAVQDSFLN